MDNNQAFFSMGKTPPHIRLRPRTEGAGLCPRCSPYFDRRGAIQIQEELLALNIEEIRANVNCPCCRLFNSLIPSATTRKVIRVCSNDSSGIDAFDEKILDPLGGIISVANQSTNENIDPSSVFRLALVDRRTWTLDFAKLRDHMDRCKLDPRCQMRAERKRYAAAIDVTLVDVERMCLVRASTRLPFVALSYVWGGLSGLMTTSTNRELLEQPGSLITLASEISATIRDALTLVAQSGEKWLWCDQLCIEQDNPSQKHSSIQQMDVIYRQSLLTIVALSSSKSSDQLPGIRPYSVRKPEYVEYIHGHRFVARVYSPLRNQITQCTYETRGWTFSERMLSSRCLYVTEDFIMYHCKNRHCDGPWETVSESESQLLKPFNYDLGALLQFDLKLNLERYEIMVRDFTSRKLSYLSDRLNAFQPVLAMLGTEDFGDVICGLPELYIDRALLWVPVDDVPSGRSPFLRNPRFASWSWAGWSGTVDYRLSVSHLIYPSAEDIQHSFQTKKRNLRRHLGPQPQPTEPAITTLGIDLLFLKTEVLGLDCFSFLQTPRLASSQMLILHNEKVVGRLYSSHRQLASASKLLFGQDERSEFRLGECEFVKLSESDNGGQIDPISGSFLSPVVSEVLVLLIGHPVAGLAERLALGAVYKSCWDSQNKTEKEVALG